MITNNPDVKTPEQIQAELNPVPESTQNHIIPKTELGRLRKRFDGMLDVKLDQKAIDHYKKVEIDLYNKDHGTSLTVDDLNAQLATLSSKSSGTGTLESRKELQDSIIDDTQNLAGIINIADSSFNGNVKLTTEQKAVMFDKLGEVASTTINHCLEQKPATRMLMLWVPQGLDTQVIRGLAVHIAGWRDGNEKPRYQYTSGRIIPVTNSKKAVYRDDSYTVLLAEVPAQKEAVKLLKAGANDR